MLPILVTQRCLELIPVYRRPARRSHPPGGRLPSVSARQVTFPAAEQHLPLAGTKLCRLVYRGT